MFEDSLFKLFGFFISLSIKFGDVSFQTIDFLGFGLNDASKDLSSWVKFTFELGFESDSFGVAVSKILVINDDIRVARLLVILMSSIVFLLFGDISVFEFA